ncbi:hypothetical protein [Methylomarinum vadi]|uniref:hypothetical protein n=1 Tax=Methylomarinum vadi TaxID=438855 RepID=UPI0004DF5696|nr:hypothetical protein [Methylomarinum vadi]
MTGRFKLFLVWFFGYAGSLLILSLYCFTRLTVDDINAVLGSALVDLTGVFAPYLTPIVAFWFAKEVIQKAAPLPQGPYQVAFICSLFYNATIILLMCALFILNASSPDYAVNQILELASTLSSGLAFLVGPAIGFYFGKTD